MNFTPGYSTRSNSVSSATAYSIPIRYQLNFKTHWHNNMYSMQNLDSPSKQQLLKESIDNDKRNFSFWMYSSKPSLNDNMPKKETLWQSVFRSATNLLGEHLTRGTSSFIKNWSYINNPLSVTVVSPDFYKAVHQEKHQLINSSKDFIIPQSWRKETYNNDEKLPNVLYENEIMSDCAKKNSSDSNDSDKRWKEYKCMYIDFNKSQEKDTNVKEKIVDSVNNSDCKDEDFQSHFNIVVIDKTVNDDPVMVEKLEELTPEIRQEQSQAHRETTGMTTMLTNAYNKVLNSMSDYLQLGSPEVDPEPESDSDLSALLTKRGCSPKIRPSKRLHDVSNGRGRGRAKSQLRRSGVSQTRHRKERNRYVCSPNIKSDMDSWEEIEYCVEDIDECDHSLQLHKNNNLHRTNFTFGDIAMKRHKPRKKNRNCMWGEIAFVPQDLDEVGIEFKDDHQKKLTIRPRLLSDSSVDSEDSYCIIFEGDTCNNECDFETDVDGYTDTEDENLPDDATVVLNRTKVRFNLIPVVHTMVQWNYAYRTARRGPWEEMARDRERFRSRINCIGRVLESVLASQHRMRIWRERFDD